MALLVLSCRTPDRRSLSCALLPSAFCLLPVSSRNRRGTRSNLLPVLVVPYMTPPTYRVSTSKFNLDDRAVEFVLLLALRSTRCSFSLNLAVPYTLSLLRSILPMKTDAAPPFPAVGTAWTIFSQGSCSQDKVVPSLNDADLDAYTLCIKL